MSSSCPCHTSVHPLSDILGKVIKSHCIGLSSRRTEPAVTHQSRLYVSDLNSLLGKGPSVGLSPGPRGTRPHLFDLQQPYCKMTQASLELKQITAAFLRVGVFMSPLSCLVSEIVSPQDLGFGWKHWCPSQSLGLSTMLLLPLLPLPVFPVITQLLPQNMP